MGRNLLFEVLRNRLAKQLVFLTEECRQHPRIKAKPPPPDKPHKHQGSKAVDFGLKSGRKLGCPMPQFPFRAGSYVLFAEVGAGTLGTVYIGCEVTEGQAGWQPLAVRILDASISQRPDAVRLQSVG